MIKNNNKKATNSNKVKYNKRDSEITKQSTS